MKAYPRFASRLALVLAAVPATSSLVFAQPVAEQVPTTVVAPDGAVAVPMEELVAPIALYPDALIALILPASTVSSDVVLAARFLKNGGAVEQVDSQPWDDSVKGLSHYPDVIKWMDENLAWTQRIGEAYVDQPQGVMDAIQRARTIARNNGVLVDTPQQQVVVQDSYIRIIPAQPDVIYVPRYDPEIIYVQRPTYYSPDPWLTFGIGFGVGSWLAYDLDWGRHSIWVDHHRHDRWRDHHDWRYRSFPGRPGFVARDPYWRRWQPLPGRPRPPHRDWNRGGHDIVRPTPLPGAPHFDRDRWQNRTSNRPDRYVGGSRPGVREAWDRSEDQRSRGNHSPGSGRRPSGTSNFVNNQPVVTPNVPVPTAVPPPTNPTIDRRDGNRGSGDRRGGGSVSVVPSERRWQRPATSDAPRVDAPRTNVPRTEASRTDAPRSHVENERRRGPADRPERSIRPSMPNVRSQSVPSQPAIAATPRPQTSAPAVRPTPAVREYRQPDRVPQAASAPAQVRTAPPEMRQSGGGGDRGSRAVMSDRGGGGGGGGGRGEGRGGGRDRQQDH